MLPPPYPMMAGKGAVPEDGYVMETEKEMDFPPSETLIVNVFPERDPVTDDGLGGLSPNSFSWSCWLISERRQFHALFVVTLVPETNVNGSGSLGVVADVGLLNAGHVVGGFDVVGVLEVEVPLETGTEEEEGGGTEVTGGV